MLLRKERGAIQKGLNLDDLKTTIVQVPSKPFQNKIEEVFYSAQNQNERSKEVLRDQELFLQSLFKLDKWQPTKENTTVKKYSESFGNSGRIFNVAEIFKTAQRNTQRNEPEQKPQIFTSDDRANNLAFAVKSNYRPQVKSYDKFVKKSLTEDIGKMILASVATILAAVLIAK